ncbi:MAG: hypothetical protein EXR57_02305 [Dehalococcoidia bacterium]|nr:hypothetical protein [Dehalococcoidia bacterium]
MDASMLHAAYHRHYNVFCNPLLWFLHHQIWNPSHTPNIDADVEDVWERGHVIVNQAFADEVVAETGWATGRPPVIIVRDGHASCLRVQVSGSA